MDAGHEYLPSLVTWALVAHVIHDTRPNVMGWVSSNRWQPFAQPLRA